MRQRNRNCAKKNNPLLKNQKGIEWHFLKSALFGFGVDYSHDDFVFIDFELPQGTFKIIPSVRRDGIEQPILTLQFLLVQGVHVGTDPWSL